MGSHLSEKVTVTLTFEPTALKMQPLASCLIYAQALLEYINFIVCVHSVNKMLVSVKFVEYKVLTFLILHEMLNSAILSLT